MSNRTITYRGREWTAAPDHGWTCDGWAVWLNTRWHARHNGAENGGGTWTHPNGALDYATDRMEAEDTRPAPSLCPSCSTRSCMTRGTFMTGACIGYTPAAHPATDRMEAEERKPVCAECNDTHVIQLAGGNHLCKSCPTPCAECSGGRYKGGAFCEDTPCGCDCHTVRGDGDPATCTCGHPQTWHDADPDGECSACSCLCYTAAPAHPATCACPSCKDRPSLEDRVELLVHDFGQLDYNQADCLERLSDIQDNHLPDLRARVNIATAGVESTAAQRVGEDIRWAEMEQRLDAAADCRTSMGQDVATLMEREADLRAQLDAADPWAMPVDQMPPYAQCMVEMADKIEALQECWSDEDGRLDAIRSTLDDTAHTHDHHGHGPARWGK